jgi:hypothetical protein
MLAWLMAMRDSFRGSYSLYVPPPPKPPVNYHPDPEIPTDDEMTTLPVEVLAGVLCGDRTAWFAGAIRHHAGRLGESVMRALLFETRRALQDGSTERPHVFLGVLIQHAERDGSELGTIQT